MKRGRKAIFAGWVKNARLFSWSKQAIGIGLRRSKAAIIILVAICMGNVALADYTIASGSTIDASTITGQSGILTINGTLNVVGNGTVNLSNFSAVIINAPNGQIYWTANGNLVLSASVSVTINTGAPGLQPTGGSASQQLIIGSTIVAVSNDNANNAAFSFSEFNAAGGLPQFILSVSTTAVCSGTAFTATITPLNNTVHYDCSWSISAAGTRSPTTHTNFNTAQTTTITPTATATYTVSCTVYVTGDNDAIVTKTKTVTVTATPNAPTSLSASPATICQGSSSNIKATSSGNSIQWYTSSSGGTSIGTSSSAANFSVTPAATTTYYAEAKINATGCTSVSRSPVTVTVNPASQGGTVTGSATVCAGTNSSLLTLGGYTGSITRWESSTDNFATAPGTIANTTPSLTVSNLAVTTYYRAVVTSGICAAAYSTVAVLTVSNPGTWLGVNTDWNSTLNWCNGSVPTATTNVIIPNGLSFYPVINTTALANNLTVATGGSAQVTVTGTLKLAGSISSSQGIDATSGTIELIGNTTQTLAGNYFSGNTVANLLVNNTLTGASSVNPSVSVSGSGAALVVSATVLFGNLNNAVLQTNDNLVLASSAVGTAGLGDITNNGANTGNMVTGKITLQRYIPAHRAWRLLTAAVTAGSNVRISDSWQEGALPVTNPAVINSSNNPNPGFGTHVTFGSPAGSGFDQGVNGNSSIYYLTNTGWNGVPAATNNGAIFNSGLVTDQPGYMLFVRGDRGTPLSLATTAVPSPTVLRIKGNINTGSQNIGLTGGLSNGSSYFRVVGNPYPSTINFHKVIGNAANTGLGFADAFYCWDPNITGSNGVGGWVAMSYNSISGTYDRSVTSSIDNSGDIQSGAAFVIDYNGAATTLRTEETNKVTASNNSQFRPVSGRNSQLSVSLLAKNADNTTSVNDGVLLSFDQGFNNETDAADMKKLNNFSENIAVVQEGLSLQIERRKPLTISDTIALGLYKMKQKDYRLAAELKDFTIPPGTMPVLEDRWLRVRLPLTNDAVTNYDFSMVGSNTVAGDRFSILLQPIARFIAATATLKNKDAFITWQLAGEFGIDHFEIERSLNGVDFAVAGIIPSAGNSDSTTSYQFTDLALSPGKFFYRVKAVSKNDQAAYSDTVSIKLFATVTGIRVFPNPVCNGVVNVYLQEAETGRYGLSVINSGGTVSARSNFTCHAACGVHSINVRSLPAGNYTLRISGPERKTQVISISIQ